MSNLTVDGIENSIRQEEFVRRVVKAANDHMRITEPTWDLYDVKVKAESHPSEGSRIAVTLLFKDNFLGFLK